MDIVRENLYFYDSIKPKDAERFYTVIATLNDSRTNQLLALATGTQANLRVFPNDIEDCHAESLLKRAYKRYLIDAALRMIETYPDLSGSNKLAKFASEHGDSELTLFVSQFPCGIIKRFEGTEPLDDTTGDPIRRKPGRGTLIGSKTVYVQRDTCSNKLKKWFESSSGFAGRTLYTQLGVRSRISRVIVGDCEPDENLNYRAYLELLKDHLGCPVADRIEFLLSSMRRDEFVFNNKHRQPMPVGTVSWSVRELDFRTEYVVDGRKLGQTKKQLLSGRPSAMLETSSQKLKSDLAKACDGFK